MHAWSEVPAYSHERIEDLLKAIPFGAELVAVEMGGTPLLEYAHPARAVYLLGAEDNGLPAAVRRRCTSQVELPFVRAASYNVAVAGSLVMYDRLAKAAAAASGGQGGGGDSVAGAGGDGRTRNVARHEVGTAQLAAQHAWRGGGDSDRGGGTAAAVANRREHQAAKPASYTPSEVVARFDGEPRLVVSIRAPHFRSRVVSLICSKPKGAAKVKAAAAAAAAAAGGAAAGKLACKVDRQLSSPHGTDGLLVFCNGEVAAATLASEPNAARAVATADLVDRAAAGAVALTAAVDQEAVSLAAGGGGADGAGFVLKVVARGAVLRDELVGLLQGAGIALHPTAHTHVLTVVTLAAPAAAAAAEVGAASEPEVLLYQLAPREVDGTECGGAGSGSKLAEALRVFGLAAAGSDGSEFLAGRRVLCIGDGHNDQQAATGRALATDRSDRHFLSQATTTEVQSRDIRQYLQVALEQQPESESEGVGEGGGGSELAVAGLGGEFDLVVVDAGRPLRELVPALCEGARSAEGSGGGEGGGGGGGRLVAPGGWLVVLVKVCPLGRPSNSRDARFHS